MTEFNNLQEPLARVYKEIRKALPHYKEKYSRIIEDVDGLDFLTGMLSTDAEINPEIQNLILKIIEDCENDRTDSGRKTKTKRIT